jgi:PAS domain S-box-containing protein
MAEKPTYEELKKRVQELQKSEIYYRTLLEGVNDAVLIHGIGVDGMPGKFIDANRAALKRLAYTHDELLKLTPKDITTEKGYEVLSEARENVISNNAAIFETTHYARNGNPIPVESHVSVVELAGQRVAVSVVRDLSERKQVMEQLRESTRRYRELFENSRDGFVVVNVSGRFIDANVAYCRMVGYSLDELKNKEDFYAITPERWRKWEHDEIWCNRLLKTNFSGVYEKEYMRKDGTIFPVELQSFAVTDDKGEIAYLWGIARDITERKQAEEALKEGFQRLEFALQGGKLGMWDWNPQDGAVVYNDLWAQMLEYRPDEVEPTVEFFKQHVHPEDLAAVLDRLTGHVEGRLPVYESEHRLRTKSGRWLWVMDRGKIVERDKDGRPVRVTGLIADITERKLAEEEKEKLQNQLNQAQKMESVGRLAGGVAHDFNNMLGVILGHTELALLQADENHDLYSDLIEIQKAAKRSANTTKQLLAFARKDVISPKKLDLNDTVESMLNMLRRLIGEDIDLVWQPSAHLWPVKMDPSQIDQILANLCINARDAIDGVGKLTIETGRKTFDEEYCKEHRGFIPGDFVLLAVSDNGCGMEKDTLANLFEPFFTTKEVGKGTGLGLATIYGIVKQNNGFINVYSEPGQGSTFKIYLPRLVADEGVKKAVPEKKAAAGGTETILLVEDEPTILRMTRMMLERKGYSVLSAATPAEAIDLAKAHADKIHLLMTDVVMPEMNGRDLAGQITALYPEIRLLFMSGYTANVIAHHGVLDDGVAFIQKPFSMADMTAKVREVLYMPSDKN